VGVIYTKHSKLNIHVELAERTNWKHESFKNWSWSQDVVNFAHQRKWKHVETAKAGCLPVPVLKNNYIRTLKANE